MIKEDAEALGTDATGKIWRPKRVTDDAPSPRACDVCAENVGYRSERKHGQKAKCFLAMPLY